MRTRPFDGHGVRLSDCCFIERRSPYYLAPRRVGILRRALRCIAVLRVAFIFRRKEGRPMRPI